MRWTLPLTLFALLAAAGCGQSETATSDTASDSRPAVAIEYVRDNDLAIRQRPSDDAPVIATYSRGSSVSVLSHRGEWAEIRVADRSGWVHGKALANNAEAKQADADNLSPRFRIPPAPVTSPGAHGEIDLEATVNQDGEVTGVTTTLNTTGSSNLVEKNINALRAARFEPIIQHGQRKPFTYEYRVHY
jgi:TonB family protein